jgi:Ni,Fe-hydrogenase I small subunit
MAITRRQFVTRLGALAAAAGFSQAGASQIMDAVAYDPTVNPGLTYQGTFGKPRVVWLHGAECTGCSTSLLGIYENLNGIAVEGTGITTATALTMAGTLPINNGLTGVNAMNTTTQLAGFAPDPNGTVNIADVVIDVIDLLYHETVQSMGGDLAYQWLNDFSLTNNKPFVLVVEGALQKTSNGGAWGDVDTVPWCSIAKNDAGTAEVVTADMVKLLGESANCVAIIAIGQCATFGGYPACKPRITNDAAGFDATKSQTDAMGTFDYLTAASSSAAAKVINAPGCPTNPWWFILTVVAFMVDANAVLGGATVGPLGILGTGTGGNLVDIVGGVDGTRRLKAVYSNSVHSAYCSKYRFYAAGVFASHPGDHGCLQKVGCKGPAARSLCGTHGWNNQQPTNVATTDTTASGVLPTVNPAATPGYPYEGGNCTRAGHPCMACTEKGYPDAFVPFVVRS